MVKISKGNVVLDVKEDFLQSYLNQGYNVVDDNGNVIQRGNPNDVQSLKIALTDANKKIDAYANENAQLQKIIKNLQAQLKKSSTKNK